MARRLGAAQSGRRGEEEMNNPQESRLVTRRGQGQGQGSRMAWANRCSMDPSRCGAAPKSFGWIHAPAVKEVDEPVHWNHVR